MKRKLHFILLDAINNSSSYDEWKKEIKKTDFTRDLLELYEKIPQGLRWHPEFELSKHIYLVSMAVHRQKKDNLLESAFLHDIGKVYATNIGKDRIYSYGHAKVSTIYVDKFKDYLEYYELTRRISEKHMDYIDAGDERIKNDWEMKEFVKADKKMSSVLFYEFFPNEEIENNKKEQEVFKSQMESNKTIYVTVGISGSGKSTYLRNNFDSNIIVSTDYIRKELTKDISNQSKNSEVWEEAKRRLLNILSKNNEAVLDATNVDKFNRINFMSSFNGIKKVAIVFPVNLEVAIERVRSDIENKVDRSNVPEKVIKKQESRFNKGLISLVHEFNEVKVVCNEDNFNIAVSCMDKIEKERKGE